MFVDPKITLSGDRKYAATLIRAARVYLDTQLHQDAAYNRQVSRTKQLLPNGAYIEATHEFSQTYLHIHVPETSAGGEKKPEKTYGSSGLYLWGIAPDGSYREYLVSHTAPYVFLLSIDGDKYLNHDPRIYVGGDGAALMPFTNLIRTQAVVYVQPILCSWKGKSVSYLPSPYQPIARNGVSYRLCGYEPFAFNIAPGAGAYEFSLPFPVSSSQSVLGGEWLWVLCTNSAAYFRGVNSPVNWLTTCRYPFYTAPTIYSISPNLDALASIGTLVLGSENVDDGSYGPQMKAAINTWNVIPLVHGLPTGQPLVAPGASPTTDGNGVVHGALGMWAPVITGYSNYADGYAQSMTATATAPVYGGAPDNLDIEETLTFYSSFNWADAPNTPITSAAWWGDLYQTNWSYAQFINGEMEVHCVACKITALQPSQEGGASFQNFTSTLTDYYTGKTTAIPGFVLWPLTANSADFIMASCLKPPAYGANDYSAPATPGLGYGTWNYTFRSWSSGPITPSQTPAQMMNVSSSALSGEPISLWYGCPACADASPMGEVFFAASDLSYVVHEPNPALPYPLPVLGSSKDTTNTKYDFDLTQLFTTLLACIWL